MDDLDRALARLADAPAPAALDGIEQDIERAWRSGQVELSIVQGGVPQLRAVS